LLVVAAALAAFARNDFGIVLKGAVWKRMTTGTRAQLL
jgi:hypothetical protein